MPIRPSSDDTKLAIIHIGIHKTGTTSFQHCLASKEDALLASKVGLFESKLSRYVGPGTAVELPLLSIRSELNFFFRTVIPDSYLPSMQSWMEKTVRDQVQRPVEVLICSHEALAFARSVEEVSRLKDLMAGRTVRIICTIRNKADFLASWRKQLNHVGMSSSSQFKDSFMYTEEDSWLVDYDSLLTPFKLVFGVDNVSVLDYDETCSNGSSIVPALWDCCGLPSHLRPYNKESWLNSQEGRKSESNSTSSRFVLKRVFHKAMAKLRGGFRR